MSESQWILSIITSFYDKAKSDILIGYHFRFIKDFDEHIPRIAIFWEQQLLTTTHQKVVPPFDMIKAHMPLGIKRGEIGRWLVLFRKTLTEKSDPQFEGLATLWNERLTLFEGIFLRFLRL